VTQSQKKIKVGKGETVIKNTYKITSLGNKKDSCGFFVDPGKNSKIKYNRGKKTKLLQKKGAKESIEGKIQSLRKRGGLEGEILERDTPGPLSKKCREGNTSKIKKKRGRRFMRRRQGGLRCYDLPTEIIKVRNLRAVRSLEAG